MEKRVYEYKIGTDRMDFQRRATIKSMFDCVLDSAGLDAEKHGFGVKTMVNELQATWVLIRMGMDIISLPQENEVIRVCTWVSEITPISSTRNFEVLDESGKLIAAATSIWTVIDINTRRMFPVNKVTKYSDMAQPEFGVPVATPLRLRTPENATSFVRKVCYSDVDYNRHCNSCKYLEWMLNTQQAYDNQKPFRLDINYVKELYQGDKMYTRFLKTQDAVQYQQVDENGVTCCSAKISKIESVTC